MNAADVMTTEVATVGPDTPVADIARLLLDRHISAAPVVDEDGAVIGIVSEGDLMRRVENDTEHRRSWWLETFTSTRERAAEFVRSHGNKARHVMTPDPVTVTEDATLADVAGILERRRIKRVPVVRDGRLVGIVSRANLLHGLATAPGVSIPLPKSDREIRRLLVAKLVEEAELSTSTINVVVKDGVVQLWGVVDSEAERQAAQVAAETTPGVTGVENNLGRVPAWGYGI